MLLHIFVLYNLLRIYKLHKIININVNIYLYIKKKKKKKKKKKLNKK